ncbi:SoxY-related AACIE arm protein [Ideonella sp. A 288]|uniref:SoxY-related AACIE arm protein n=1 Tax=Ideonella sp. A 288 TaxID=1962181 RepID=UPI000B4AE8AE|nr:SoxY-related AACIE arm protein [Ideonella sp. A 288]
MSQASRRQVVVAGLLASVTLRPLRAAELPLEPGLREAIRAWSGTVTPRDGRVTLDIAPLVDNGNTVPVTVRVDSPMTEADHVRELVIFNERNPQRDVAQFTLGPANGRAEVSTRIRLATTQRLVALARMSDHSVWQQQVEVIVTLAACIE